MLGRRGLAEEGLKEYLLHRDAKTPALKAEVESLPAKDVQLLNLGYDWLSTYLPHVMQKIDRVTFGIMTDAQAEAALEAQPLMPLTRTKLAIPFVGKVCVLPCVVPCRCGLSVLSCTVIGGVQPGLNWRCNVARHPPFPPPPPTASNGCLQGA